MCELTTKKSLPQRIALSRDEKFLLLFTFLKKNPKKK
ncbi:rCG43233 [Rattus norvegicus]|uniref:RCG43233 n=1 Tax=Rattus norvegicus TaxID=10116 RepID=A6IVJ2_RAT|nr:rCG43233 [Rattus norvegicus]